jgi:hypothetical protein
MPVASRNFLHDLKLKVALGNKLLQPRILGLKLLQAPHAWNPPNRLRHV